MPQISHYSSIEEFWTLFGRKGDQYSVFFFFPKRQRADVFSPRVSRLHAVGEREGFWELNLKRQPAVGLSDCGL